MLWSPSSRRKTACGPVLAGREASLSSSRVKRPWRRGWHLSRRKRYRIEYMDEAVEHLRGLTARERAAVLDSVEVQLRHEPTIPTRNRKLLGANPVAPWELRIGAVRVYFDVVDVPRALVTVRAVGIKIRERVRIGGVEVDLG